MPLLGFLRACGFPSWCFLLCVTVWVVPDSPAGPKPRRCPGTGHSVQPAASVAPITAGRAWPRCPGVPFLPWHRKGRWSQISRPQGYPAAAAVWVLSLVYKPLQAPSREPLPQPGGGQRGTHAPESISLSLCGCKSPQGTPFELHSSRASSALRSLSILNAASVTELGAPAGQLSTGAGCCRCGTQPHLGTGEALPLALLEAAPQPPFPPALQRSHARWERSFAL